MKLKLNLNNVLMMTTIVTIFLLVSSPAVAVPSSTPLLGLDTFSTTPNIEFANIVAGEDQAVYATIFTYGGITESGFPVDTTIDGFTNARSWYVASIQQDDFATFLQRKPAPVEAPDGISLHLSYRGGVVNSLTTTQGWSVAAAQEVESTYGITFTSQYILSTGAIHRYMWIAETDVLADVAADVDSLGTVGFSQLLDASVISSAPVAWTGYGARLLAGSQVAMFGAGWVDADGITSTVLSSDTLYSISTSNIFGGTLSPNTAEDQSLARVTIRVPYPIEPTSINVPTSNPLPHVTGIFQWDLRHPVWGSKGAQSDLKVDFFLDTDSAFPNVQNKFSIDQAKLTSQGILDATFKLTNIGSEDAQNIDVVFPLGPQFEKLNNAKPIWTIKNDFDLDTTYNPTFNVSVGVNTGSFNEQILDYKGWYRFTANNSLAFWDSLTTSMTATSTVSVGGVGAYPVSLGFIGPQGFPQAIVDGFNNKIKPAVEATTTLSEFQQVLDQDLKQELRNAFNKTVNTFYEKKDTFVVDTGDFDVSSFTYSPDGENELDYYYLNSSISSLLVNESSELKFAINNIPIESDNFQFIDYDASLKQTTFDTGISGIGEVTVDVPDVLVNSSEQNYFEFMQYIFQILGYDGRPLSFGFDNRLQFGLDDFISESFHKQSYMSWGAFHRFENTQGFPFFGISNGQNLQIADDEAVVTATVNLDKQVYNPGESKVINVTMTNNGDIAAENVKAHVYHGTLGRGWSIERASKISTIELSSSLAPGETVSELITVEANSFVGYSPVFAIVEFDSDLGQGAAPIPDFFDQGITEYEAAGETHHYVTSTLTGALLVAENPGLTPTVQEPKVEISSEVVREENSNEFTITYTLENTGETDTTATFGQFFDNTDFEYVDHSHTSPDAVTTDQPSSFEEYSWLYVTNIQLGVGDSVEVSITFEIITDEDTELWPGFVYYTIAGESSLGGRFDVDSPTTIGSESLLSLSAGAAAQQQSQKSATEDSTSSSYSASSSIGAAVNTELDTTTKSISDVPVIGFLGYDAIGFLGLMLVPLGLYAFYRRKKY